LAALAQLAEVLGIILLLTLKLQKSAIDLVGARRTTLSVIERQFIFTT
jgi:hypothetical protein